ncbi:MAG TPA: recombinase family protein [Methyloceanibacter sp.]|nr:recombinase family protein [Methyloceanibacter sp.]
MQQRLDGGRWELIAEFVEIESGKRAKRPQLDAALAVCKKHNAELVVAKLDRLSRNVSFLLKLIESGVEVLFADLPELNGAIGNFVLITMANVAELEAGLISERTKAALKAAKARGVRLGRHGAEVLAPKYRKEALQRAKQLETIIRELREKGYSLNRIAAELNKRKVPTPRGGRWDHSSVRNVVRRLMNIGPEPLDHTLVSFALLHRTARVRCSRNFSYRNRVCLIRRGPPRGPHMSYAKPLLMSRGAAASCQQHPARMSLSGEQRSHVAAAYEKAAADPSLPGFAKKADWFRLLARVGEKKERAALIASERKQTAQESLPNPFWFWGLQAHGDEGWQGAFYSAT